jgi:hypothetical protein
MKTAAFMGKLSVLCYLIGKKNKCSNLNTYKNNMPHLENSWKAFTCASGISDRHCGKILLRIQFHCKEIMV